MAVLNINDEPTQAMVLLDPATGLPTLPGQTPLTLEAALMLFPTKEQVNSAVSNKANAALLVPAERGQATYVGYGQAVPLIVKSICGEDIRISGKTISLKGGKTYKLQASLSALYPQQSGAFAFTKPNSCDPIGTLGATNGAPYNWTSKGDAVAVIDARDDVEVQLTYLCPWFAYSIWGGYEWEYNMPAGSWITVEEVK